MFKGLKLVGLTEETAGSNQERYGFLIQPNETVELEYKTIRDLLILTNKRLITVDIQGLRGKKAEFFSLPYSKITAFSVESAGTFDLDCEFKIWASGLGDIEFAFLKGTDVKKIATLLSSDI
ncbi:TPA: PH domain-containing protein [Vibrio cholerae]|uniref:PH domain-containing protein n=1 Tax=Vibrio cholerae TaxID=666 RepID=UPI0015CF08E0|nr:PH domain-containing protein [Vibrio cholerae]EGR0499543.1 PH domain-containing protein [Vibrio cholerae]EGR4142003.1 PH domain-containing protein [Vibrio cholerae]EGZ6888397.1 PH domain-containing protein [Vibrio cholerae]MDV2300342.1 PH domain-containing protein [Vibrio cholerae]HDZ1815518.1 PH domain-containing protein [Vibrio cholerae]